MNGSLLDFKTISKLDLIFSKVDLYQDIVFDVYKKNNEDKYSLDKDELSRFLKAVDYDKQSIDAYCVFCKKEYSFDVTYKCASFKASNMGKYYNGIEMGAKIFINFDELDYSAIPNGLNSSDFYKCGLTYINYDFTCNKDNSHLYKMFVVIFACEGRLIYRKIGQFPSKIDIWGFDFEKYKKQLDKFDSYSDFKKAELCMSDKLFAGAYTYLRRVFEKMLDLYCRGIELPDNRPETKIEFSKSKFDPRITPLLTNLYGILSKGIHQLDDEESENYYIYLRAVIEMQLEHIKELNEKEEQTTRLKSEIDKIAFNIKK